MMKTSSPVISVIVITFNEADDIQRCLSSVQWADEIIVFDSGSNDGTQAICRQFTNKIFETDWPGYGPQKNRALEQASGDWVLSIDADEKVPHELQMEIKQAVLGSRYQAYSLTRQSSYCGKWLAHGAWRKDSVVRLFQRCAGQFNQAIVHETLQINGKVGQLISPLLHYTYKDINEIINKINSYSSASAQIYLAHNKKGGLIKAIIHGCWAFIRSYFIQFGFLDGREGFMLAVSNAEYVYYRYLKLMYMNNQK